jgi:Flp pilus assembly CpaE family ATPase
MDTYEKLGYSKGKIKFVLSAPFIRSSISKEKIESALGIQAITTIPYVQDVLVEAINLGQPMTYHAPKERISGVFEDLGFLLSKDADRKSKPKKPSSAWNRVYQRYQERKK